MSVDSHFYFRVRRPEAIAAISIRSFRAQPLKLVKKATLRPVAALGAEKALANAWL
jgi:hypothetical protein